MWEGSKGSLEVAAGYHLLFGALGGLAGVIAIGVAARRGIGKGRAGIAGPEDGKSRE